METTGNKSRTQSRCREWERNRRNKFNDAIARLGEVVKKIDKANCGSKEPEKEQYPKIEIVERAIVCLTRCLHEKTQLKAEILALQVKMDTEKKQKENKKDVSTQVFIGISKKNKRDKYVKVLMLQKSKRKALKEKTLTTNATVDCKISNLKGVTHNSPPKLPTLLPKANINDKKGPENTIVVLPATPYIFQQRPFILPTVPPAFVLVDQNMQTLNKSSFSIVNRSNNDITKTTMVNILPISAYSRPLSATKTKKSSKAKLDLNKKTKKAKPIIKSKQEKATTCSEVSKSTPLSDDSKEIESSNDRANEVPQVNKVTENDKTTVGEVNANKESCITKVITNVTSVAAVTISAVSSMTTTEITIPKSISCIEVPKIKNYKVTEEVTSKDRNFSKCDAVAKSVPLKTGTQVAENTVDKNKTNKTEINPSDKVPVVDTEKENKITNILNATLCETGVDGGNARLELAEEFLAASPTAAFLMSFPLVSGNRADSPAEEPSASLPVNSKETNQRRSEIATQAAPYYEKSNHTNIKSNPSEKLNSFSNNTVNKLLTQNKYIENNTANKSDNSKMVITTIAPNVSNENPFLNLPMSSLLPTTCTLSDTTFGLEFDCNISKSMPSQSSSYASNSNIFYKSDPFSTVKSAIYSTSSISSGHEFNSFGLYPCAMEKYSAKNKTDYSNVEENLMKIGSSRLTYDIDLGWSHKGFDFVSCTSAANTFSKDNILTTASGPYSTSYNPFNPDFHVPLVSTSSSKKDSTISKTTTSFSDTITSFYSQPTNLWNEDVPFYSNSNISKSLSHRHQNYLPVDHAQTNIKLNNSKQYEPKEIQGAGVVPVMKPSHSGSTQQVSEKYKKSPNKMHINWMTSEVRPMQPICNPVHAELKENHKSIYNQSDNVKKQDHSENNYFPISMHNFPSQSIQEELQVWPTARTAGTTEITMEPPPINLPTLVGDLALGPHDKRKTAESLNRGAPQPDIQNCSNFFSVTQLMNRSTDNNVLSRFQGPSIESHKPTSAKPNISHITNDSTNRKLMTHTDIHSHQPCYVFNDAKPVNSYESVNQFPPSKVKTNKSDKSSKAQKNSYSAEALIRGGTCNPKIQDNNSAKYMIPSQKYNDFNTPQDSNVAQVSHFPPILDYSDNSYSGQQFSGTNLYNATTNTISNSFYSNFMPGSSNIMAGNYTSGPFSSDFIDYNQPAECSYPNHKYTDLKMRNNPATFQHDKPPSYKSSRRESASKHKLECSKKDTKKCQNKRTKLNNDAEDWSDASQLWQNKTPSKRHSNLMSEDIPFPNYVGNQMAAGQYQPDFFNSHIMPSNMQPVPVGHNVDRSLASFPSTSRANFNLSTIFPEITMKVQ